MKQHFVPECYLKAWCDPKTPNGFTPYVWKFSKDGKSVKNAAPHNIFKESEMYTIRMPDGSNDYRLEHGLHDIEDHFVRIRDNKLSHREELSEEEHILLLAFVAAMHGRTRTQRNHQKAQWGRVFDVIQKMKKWAETATPEQRRAAASLSLPSKDKKDGLTYEQVEKLATEPMQHLLFQFIEAEVPLLHKLNFAILQTSNTPGFITSDNPCVWYDPKWYLRPPIYQAPALMYPTIEITLPVSPKQHLLLNRAGIEGYVDANDQAVDDLNRRTRFECHEHFIVNKKAIWFYQGIEPTDSWEKTHPLKNEHG